MEAQLGFVLSPNLTPAAWPVGGARFRLQDCACLTASQVPSGDAAAGRVQTDGASLREGE